MVYCHNDYSVSHCDRPTHGGGVCIFVNTHINCVRIFLPREYAQLELLCFDIIQDQWRHRFVIVYRPPRYTVQQTESNTICSNFFCNVFYVVTKCEDFTMLKIDLINGYDLAYLPALETRSATFVIDNGLHQLVREPRRGTKTLDLLMTNDPIAISFVSVTCPFSISDHRCVKWCVWLLKHCVQQSERASAKRFDFQSI